MASDPILFTEFEEEIYFDSDDPDFYSCNHRSLKNIEENKENMHLTGVISPAMSMTSLAASNRSHSYGSISSLDDYRYQTESTVISIEQIRQQLNSCFTCGVSWPEDHVSLDCAECGGYSLQRPCVKCDGKCHMQWKRDLAMSHTTGKARWLGECAFNSQDSTDRIIKPVTSEHECGLYNHRNNNF